MRCEPVVTSGVTTAHKLVVQSSLLHCGRNLLANIVPQVSKIPIFQTNLEHKLWMLVVKI